MRTIFSLALLVLVSGLYGTSPAAAQAQIDPQWAQQFVGSWDVTLQTPDGAVPMVVAVLEEAGKLAVQLSRGGEQGNSITEVHRAEDTLVAAYTMNYQGMTLPATLTLKREGETLNTRWEFAEGLYETSHQATKR